MAWGAQIYVKRLLDRYEQFSGKPETNHKVYAPLELGEHLEIDESPLLDMKEIKKYWQMIGEIQLDDALSCIDITAMTTVDHITDLHYTLCMLGVPLTRPSWLFGDNLSAVSSATLSSGKIVKALEYSELSW
eukprot:1642351-Ditylum_brightwellii.AAC.1